MNAGLAYLLGMGPRRKLRDLGKRTRGTRRRAFSVLGGLLLLAWVIGQLRRFGGVEHAAHVLEAEAGIRLFAPLAISVMALLGVVVGYGLHFRPAEIDFLFPAPITRRELLLYNVAARLGVAAMSSLWLALVFAHRAPRWWAGVVGVYLIVVFLQFVAKLSVLVFSALSVEVKTKSPYLAPLLIASVVLVISVTSRSRVAGGATVGDTLSTLARTPLARLLTAPTRVFVEVFLAHDLANFMKWMAGALAMLGTMLATMLALDARFEEGALRVQQELEARTRRMRAGGGAYASAAPSRALVTLPLPPRLGGAGPIAWRQGMEALRHARGLVTALSVMTLTALAPVLLVRGDDALATSSAGRIAIGIVLVATLSVTQQFPFDFRRDLDRIPLLKTLPLSPTAIAFGQLVPTVVIFSAIHVLVLGVVLGVSRLFPVIWLSPVAIALVPFNWVHVALDNGLFLLMPQRFEMKDTGGFRIVDRLGVMLIKMPLLASAAALAATLGGALFTVTRGSALAAGVGAGIGFASIAWPLTWWVGRLFARFDVPRDTPE